MSTNKNNDDDENVDCDDDDDDIDDHSGTNESFPYPGEPQMRFFNGIRAQIFGARSGYVRDEDIIQCVYKHTSEHDGVIDVHIVCGDFGSRDDLVNLHHENMLFLIVYFKGNLDISS